MTTLLNQDNSTKTIKNPADGTIVGTTNYHSADTAREYRAAYAKTAWAHTLQAQYPGLPAQHIAHLQAENR